MDQKTSLENASADFVKCGRSLQALQSCLPLLNPYNYCKLTKDGLGNEVCSRGIMQNVCYAAINHLADPLGNKCNSLEGSKGHIRC